MSAQAMNSSECGERAALRARLFLRVVLPLIELIVEQQPGMLRFCRGKRHAVQIGVDGSPTSARLVFSDGGLRVEQGPGQADIAIAFSGVAALNAFFSGKPALPRLRGALRHPVLLLRVLRLISTLRILQPQAAPRQAAARAMRVKLLLTLATRALAEMRHGGHGGMMKLSASSPERVYQWTVEREAIVVWLYVNAGRVESGSGPYAERAPFVHFVFPDADAALAMLTATGSQMHGVREGWIRITGSPEYSRKISFLMQQMDALLMEG